MSMDMLATPNLLKLGSNLAPRRTCFVSKASCIPAKLHLEPVRWLIDRSTLPEQTISDPMAGVESLLLAATMQRNVIEREIEPR